MLDYRTQQASISVYVDFKDEHFKFQFPQTINNLKQNLLGIDKNYEDFIFFSDRSRFYSIDDQVQEYKLYGLSLFKVRQLGKLNKDYQKKIEEEQKLNKDQLDAKKQIEKEQKLNREKQEQIEQLNNQIIELQTQSKLNLKKKLQADSKLYEMELKIQNLNDQILAVQPVQEQFDGKKNELNGLQEELKQFRKQNIDYEEKIKQLNKELTNSKEFYEYMKQQYGKDIEQLKQEKLSLLGELKFKDSIYQSQTGNNQISNSQVDQLNQEIQKLKDKIVSIESVIQNLNKYLENIQLDQFTKDELVQNFKQYLNQCIRKGNIRYQLQQQNSLATQAINNSRE